MFVKNNFAPLVCGRKGQKRMFQAKRQASVSYDIDLINLKRVLLGLPLTLMNSKPTL